ncbi:hypothetical protein ABFX02_14G005500 [Erythranthe guttata]
MAFSASINTSINRHWLLLVSTMICMLLFTCTSVTCNINGEGETDDNFPDPVHVFNKALECLNDKYIYSSCDEEHRLTQNGELNVPPEYADEYCNGACLKETYLVLDCIDDVIKYFVFYNKATLRDIRETIKCGCSYGPKRGDFNVEEHIQADEGVANNSMINPFYYALLLIIIVGWHILF